MNKEQREQIERTFRKSLVKALEVFDEEARVLDTFAEGKDEEMDASYRKFDKAITAARKVRDEQLANLNKEESNAKNQGNAKTQVGEYESPQN